MIWVLPLVALIVFEGIADVFAEEYSLHRGSALWIAAILAYIIANIFWLVSLKNGSGLARGGTIFSVASSIIAVVLGIFLFQEKLNAYQLAGIGFGIVSLVLIFWEQ
jgi:glucose uptake protein GlcU